MVDQVYAATYEEYTQQMELMLRRSVIHTNGPAPPPGVLLPVKPEPTSPPRSPLPRSHSVQIGRRVKEEPASPPRDRVKNEQASTLLPVKEESTSPWHNRDVQIGHRMTDEPTSLPHNSYDRIDKPSSSLLSNWHDTTMKEEVRFI